MSGDWPCTYDITLVSTLTMLLDLPPSSGLLFSRRCLSLGAAVSGTGRPPLHAFQTGAIVSDRRTFKKTVCIPSVELWRPEQIRYVYFELDKKLQPRSQLMPLPTNQQKDNNGVRAHGCHIVSFYYTLTRRGR